MPDTSMDIRSRDLPTDILPVQHLLVLSMVIKVFLRDTNQAPLFLPSTVPTLLYNSATQTKPMELIYPRDLSLTGPPAPVQILLARGRYEEKLDLLRL
jgi:hypothetical protein